MPAAPPGDHARLNSPYHAPCVRQVVAELLAATRRVADDLLAAALGLCGSEKMAQKMADEAAELRKAAHALEFAQVELFSASATVVPTTLELNVPRASRCVSICPDLPAAAQSGDGDAGGKPKKQRTA